jgi:L-aspartate oxidase
MAKRDAQPVDRQGLQTLMWNAVGIERNAAGLKDAEAQLDGWEAMGDSVQDLETANLLLLARIMTAAALARRESRGAHFREDYPKPVSAFAHPLVYVKNVEAAAPCY